MMIRNKIKTCALNKYINIISEVIGKYNKNNSNYNIKILDVGSGNCNILSELDPEYCRVGIDLHEHQHFKDNTFMTFTLNKNSNFIFADALRLPFPDNTFDLVFSNEFISHVSNIDKSIQEQIRVLKKGGTCVIMDSNPINPYVFLSCFFLNFLFSRHSAIKRGGMKWLLHRDEPFFEYAPTKKGLRKVYWMDENIHPNFWWKRKILTFPEMKPLNIQTFWSFLPFNFLGNKVLAILEKKS